MSKHHVIYVPGIMDNAMGHGFLIKTWWLYGLSGHCHAMPWAGQENYEPKLERLLNQIDKYTAKGHKVSLLGFSAGASAVINAYVERSDKINSVILVCPKINGPETVSDRTYADNPAFKTSMYTLQTSLKKFTVTDKAKIRTYYSPTDTVVPYAAVPIAGVEEVKLPKLRHGQAIVYCLTLGASNIARFLKSLA